MTTLIPPEDFALLERSEDFLSNFLQAELLEPTVDEPHRLRIEKAMALLADIRNRIGRAI